MLHRLKDLKIFDIKEYPRYKNPEHARLYTLLSYTTGWLYFYRKQKQCEWVKKEIQEISKINKRLKTLIKECNRHYDFKTKLDAGTL